MGRFLLAALVAAFVVGLESTCVINIPGWPPITLPPSFPCPPWAQKTTTTTTTTTTKATTTAKASTTTPKASTTTAKASSTTAKPSSSSHAPSTTTTCPTCVAPLLNWGANFNFSTQNIKFPTTTEAVQDMVTSCPGKIRPLGTRHSFSQIANSNDTILSMTHMNLILAVDPSIPSVTVQAGITFTDLVPFLSSIGLALPMLASLGEISIAGACQTGAHGSGPGIGSLATQIYGLQMVLADGSVVQYTRGENDTEIQAAAVGLGALGIITQVELKVEPAYNLATNAYLNMSIDTLAENFDAIESSGYAVNLWQTFTIPNSLDAVFVTSKLDGVSNNQYLNASNMFGSPAATTQYSPIAALPAPYTAPQLGVPGPWYERLTDYALGLSGQEGQQTQTEYYVAYEDFIPALRALQPLASQIAPVLYVALYRIVEADDLWMSPAYNRTVMCIHFSWIPDLPDVMAVVPQIEAALAPWNPIPHWGKIFTQAPHTYLSQIPQFNAWKAKVQELDPTQKFRNQWLSDNIFV